MNKKRFAHRGRPAPQRRPRATLEILYEDDFLLAANKPAGIQTRAGRSDSRRSFHDIVLDHTRGNDASSQRVRPINHLDADVSGIILFAKSRRVEDLLERLFRSHGVKRTYGAVLEGTLEIAPETTGTIQSASEADPRRRRAPTPQGSHRKPSTTHYRLTRQSEERALVKLRPESHRKNQLIEHTRQIGRPIVGDHGTHTPPNVAGRLMLHLETMSFAHPKTGQDLWITAPLPREFGELVDTDVRPPQPRPNDTSWNQVADWYANYQASAKSDHFADVIHPGALRLLGNLPGRRVLDVACGEGAFAELMARAGASVVGVDSAQHLIKAAAARSLPSADFVVGDASRLASIDLPHPETTFDAACCIMALMNIDNMPAAISGIAQRLCDGGSFVAVLLHPAFRSPKQTSWGWDDSSGSVRRQFRRVDAYLSESSESITMNPGRAAHGAPPITTYTFHRPLSVYISALSAAGFSVDAFEEWPSSRRSQPGPHADEENRVRAEIPMFCAIRARKQARS